MPQKPPFAIQDPASVAAIRTIFAGLQLPVPDSGEYYRDSSNQRCLVFLNDHGLVLRITHKNYTMKARNPHFLKPLFNRAAGDDYVFDIDPGIDSPVSEEEKKTIYAMLKERHNIYVTDGKPQNLGYLPGVEPRFPVMIDLDPNHIHINGRYANLMVMEGPLIKTPQDEFYKPLRDIIETAWPEDRELPDPHGINKFLQTALAFREAGRLSAPWTQEENSYRDSTSIARNYARRLRFAQTLSASV